MSAATTKLSSSIRIKGARLHNLKNVNVDIPRNKLVVITGLSGSGKSSLAFDTLYAEGQRRYVESLSSYARQFLGRLNKPEVDSIQGIAPAIAIEQKVNSKNPRSTVGTSTEIYEYLKLLFARIGKTFSPVSGREVKRHQVADVIAAYKDIPEGEKIMICCPIIPNHGRSLAEQLQVLQQIGYARVYTNNETLDIADCLESLKDKQKVELVIDRLKVAFDDDSINRLADSVETAFFEGKGDCKLRFMDSDKQLDFNNRFELDGMEFEEPSIHLFTFNNPVGACPKCEGYGSVIGIDEELVIPNTNLSVYEDAILCWRGEKMQKWKNEWIMEAHKHDFPIHAPYFELSDEQKDMLWNGVGKLKGINHFFEYVESKSYKIQYRVMLSRYRGKTKCPVCNGLRLNEKAGNVKIDGYTIQDLVKMPVKDLQQLFPTLNLSEAERGIAKRLLIEINNRLSYLCKVGLGYLNLNRASSTLSGGESQRINLATSLGSSLVGSMYILDEPSIGLHPKDSQQLLDVLRGLRDLGNTVIVVEHEEEIIRAADYIIDMGPGAGFEGGELVFAGEIDEMMASADTLTAKYLSGELSIERPEKKKGKFWIELTGARANNLKNIDIKLPLNALTVVTGVSGSGKSSLVRDILYPALKRRFDDFGDRPGPFKELKGDLGILEGIEFIDQNPIGKSSRSNPVTYIKAYDDIRGLFASQSLAKSRAYQPKHFSFNVEGGRCPVCEGEGTVTVEMQFMADVHLNCEECKGQRFKEEILEIKVNGKSIYDILELTIAEAITFFQEIGENKIAGKLQPLYDVGLGYVHLGQSSSTLSGGEAQRVKLAAFLGQGKSRFEHKLFIFDEPTTGLHFHDINKLLKSFYALLEQGHSIMVIEHNSDVIACADWVIDLGPEGGVEGGYLVDMCSPEELANNPKSHTGKFLKAAVSTK